MNAHNETAHAQLLVCPVTKLRLELLSLPEAEISLGGRLSPRSDLPNAKGGVSKPAGVTDTVLVREDNKCAYPVVNGIPVLLAPESLSISADDPAFDLTDRRYAEAYEEMEFYNTRASETIKKLDDENGAWSVLPTEMAATEQEKRSFPSPWYRWIDAVHDLASQWDSYSHLGAMPGKRLLQVGGSGTHTIKFLMAGAAEAWLVTPMAGEAAFARGLADAAGVGERFWSVVGIAEELPFTSEAFDGIFTGGCLHHTVTELALPEAARVLKPGGRFAAAEPWQAPLYAIGTKVLGKREDAYCRPLTSERLKSLDISFSSTSLIRHGTLTRYPLLALEKFGIPINKALPWHAGKMDDAISSLIPGMRKMGSSISVLGTK